MKKRYFTDKKWSCTGPDDPGTGDKEPDAAVRTHNLSNLEAANFHPKQWKMKESLKFMDYERHDEPKRQRKRRLNEKDPFPGDAPVPVEKIKKYNRGESTDLDGVRTKYHVKKLQQKEEKYEQATKQAARTELLLTEEPGFIEADDGELTSDYSQNEIARSVDITSAQKFFELKMDKFGPYTVNYSRNGRFLLLGGGRGHVAAIDWQTKKLMCEMNVMETCTDAKWLHIETMFAVSQRKWTYIYDNQGIELHCLKGLDTVLRMEFLPYHFLLATGNSKGYLQWIDTSVGKKVAGFSTGFPRLDVMCQNPSKAVINLGHPGGTVTMWSPNVKEPLVKMLCHGSGTRSVTVTKDGNYMATSGIDRTTKIWDLRMFKLLHGYRVGAGASQMSFSHRGVLAAAMGNIVEVYRDPCKQAQSEVYLNHRLPGTGRSLEFCPYEDVLGVGHSTGFASLLVPGSGEANFDALEANPFQSKKQRNHAEVKMLLEKIQPDMISLDTSALGKVDTKTLKQTVEDKKKLLYVKPQAIDFEPRYKKKGKSKTGNLERRKKGFKEEEKLKQLRITQQQDKLDLPEDAKSDDDTKPKGPYNALDRFTKKAS